MLHLTAVNSLPCLISGLIILVSRTIAFGLCNKSYVQYWPSNNSIGFPWSLSFGNHLSYLVLHQRTALAAQASHQGMPGVQHCSVPSLLSEDERRNEGQHKLWHYKDLVSGCHVLPQYAMVSKYFFESWMFGSRLPLMLFSLILTASLSMSICYLTTKYWY